MKRNRKPRQKKFLINVADFKVDSLMVYCAFKNLDHQRLDANGKHYVLVHMSERQYMNMLVAFDTAPEDFYPVIRAVDLSEAL